MEQEYDVFISFKNSDKDGCATREKAIAEQLCEYLKSKGILVFYSAQELEFLGKSQYTKVINKALESSRILVVVGSSRENLESEWGHYEWDSFLNAIRTGVKRNGEVYVLTDGMKIPDDLPWGLMLQQAFNASEDGVFEKIGNFISHALERSDLSGKPDGSKPRMPVEEVADSKSLEKEPARNQSTAKQPKFSAKSLIAVAAAAIIAIILFAVFFNPAKPAKEESAVKSPVETGSPVTAAESVKDTRPMRKNFVRIKGGTFKMGSHENEPGRWKDEVPQHQITLGGFYMSKHPVTQKQYEMVMGTNPANFKGLDLPVENVSWYDALVFCNRLSVREKLEPAYRISGSTNPEDWGAVPESSDSAWDNVQIVSGSTGYRLPTEAQWEYACRAGTTTPFSTGNNITTSQANFDGRYPFEKNEVGENRMRTTPVGSFSPNPWGLFDMHGNVLEWCWNWFEPYQGQALTDPPGAVSGEYRIVRGGAWSSRGRNVRSAYRGANYPYSRKSHVGFRLVLPD